VSASGCIALGRLAEVLDGPRRRALQAAMLADVLNACMHADAVGETYVVTNDPGAATVAASFGAGVLADHTPPRGMNPAVEIGLAHANARHAEAALVLTADLPQATASALEGLLRASAGWPITLVPSDDGTGTNAMVLRPPGALSPRLGPDSLARHTAAAERTGRAHQVVPVAALAVDVDHPEDLLKVVDSGACGVEFTRAWRVVGMDRCLTTASPSC
jgi:2-phospho-L-lactate guanylyltransferase